VQSVRGSDTLGELLHDTVVLQRWTRLTTAQACMQGYRVWVPPGGTAAETAKTTEHAQKHVAAVMTCRTASSMSRDGVRLAPTPVARGHALLSEFTQWGDEQVALIDHHSDGRAAEAA
jgi:hypothetical protein